MKLKNLFTLILFTLFLVNVNVVYGANLLFSDDGESHNNGDSIKTGGYLEMEKFGNYSSEEAHSGTKSIKVQTNNPVCVTNKYAPWDVTAQHWGVWNPEKNIWYCDSDGKGGFVIFGTSALSHQFSATPEVYAEWWVKMPEHFVDNKIGYKWMRLNWAQPSGGVLTAWTDGAWSDWWSAAGYSKTAGHWDGLKYVNAITWKPYGTVAPSASWRKVALYAKTNSPDKNDGIFRIFFDDKMHYESTSFRWNHDPGGTTLFSYIHLTSNFGNPNDITLAYLKDSNAGIYVDDVKIWDGMPNSERYNLAHFTNLISNWLKTISGTVSDVNKDNMIDARDLGIIMNGWE